MKRYSKERDAGRVAVHLAQFYFFGESVMARTTAAHLDPAKMGQIKSLVLGKFGARRSLADKEDLWRKMQGFARKDSVVMARAFPEL